MLIPMEMTIYKTTGSGKIVKITIMREQIDRIAWAYFSIRRIME